MCGVRVIPIPRRGEPDEDQRTFSMKNLGVGCREISGLGRAAQRNGETQ